MALSIRVARESDADAIAQLARQLGYDVDRTLVPARLARILQRPDHRFVVAEDEGQVVAWLHALVFEYIESDPFVVIGGLVVDRNHRRKGIGRTLMEDAENWARVRHSPVVRLWSSDARANAHRFYEGLGYRHIKTQYSFAKPLDPSKADALTHFVPRIEESPEEQADEAL